MIRNRRGYSIIEVFVVVAIMSFAFGGIGYALSAYIKQMRRATVAGEINLKREQISRSLVDNCSWTNTLRDATNTSLQCLSTNSCTNGQVGAIATLRNRLNQVIFDNQQANSGIDESGEPCLGFSETNHNPACPFRLEISWTAMCTGACADPELEFRGQLKQASNTPSQLPNMRLFTVVRNFPNIFRTCDDVRASGRGSGVYIIDPDATGPNCPFEVYCDNVNDGGGWALAINATIENYSELPVVREPLLPTRFGRLSNEQISMLLAGADATRNNIRMDVQRGTSIATGLPQTISIRATGSSQGSYAVNDPTCNIYDSPSLNAAFTAGTWSFLSGDSVAGVGFIDGPAGTFKGFTCRACTSAGTGCSLAAGECCVAANTPAEFMMGSVWVR